MPARRKLTPEVADQIVELIRAGRPKWVAADHVGVHRDTLDEWIKRGEAKRAEGDETPESERVYEDLAVRVRRAAAEFFCSESDSLVSDGVATKADWNRRKWRLKLMFPKELAERESVEVTGPDGGAIKHQHAHDVSSHDLLAALDAFAGGIATDRDGRRDTSAGGGESDADAESDTGA